MASTSKTTSTKTEEQQATEAFNKSAGIAPEAQGTLGVTNAEPNVAPQGPVAGPVVYGQGEPVPQTGGVHPSNLGEYGIVKGQLPEAIDDPVREAEQASATREPVGDEEPLSQEEIEAQGRVEIGEPEVHGQVKEVETTETETTEPKGK